MRNFLISNDPKFRAASVTEDGTIVAFPHADGGKIDGTKPQVLNSFEELSDNAGISERSHVPDNTIERIVTEFLKIRSI